MELCNIVTVAPSNEPPVIVSSTCPDSPELETKCDKVGKCDAAAMVPYDGLASSTSSTCPDESRKTAKS